MWEPHDRLLEISTPRYFAQVMQDLIMKFVGGFESKTLLKTAPDEGGGRGGGAYAASQTTVLHMKRLNQTESPIFVILCGLCFQRQSISTFI